MSSKLITMGLGAEADVANFILLGLSPDEPQQASKQKIFRTRRHRGGVGYNIRQIRIGRIATTGAS